MTSLAATGALLASGIMATQAFKLVVKDIYEQAKKSGGDRYKSWRYAKIIDEMYKSVDQIRFVKTLWQIDKKVDISDFYYKTTLIDQKSTASTISNFVDLPQKSIIRGTVGQGKSIFMRYIACRELQLGKSVPLFLELVRLNDGRSLEKHLQEHLTFLGFPDENDVLQILLKTGRITLFLDGFDEIKQDLRLKIFNAIERLPRKYKNLHICITSRPNTELYTSTQFEVLDVSKLDIDDIDPIVRRLMSTRGNPDELLTQLKNSSTDVMELLDTPLMVTLLLLRYASRSRIPESFAEFYDSLFLTLLTRHDESKPGGFQRERKSGLTDTNMRKVFNAVSFKTKNIGSIEYNRKKITTIVDASSNEPDCKCNPEYFLSDIHNITSLLMREGDMYRYIHKSVQEYHAAEYIQSIRDERAKKFYSTVRLKSRFFAWKETLAFLREIDSDRYEEFLLIPDYENLFRYVLKRLPKKLENLTRPEVMRIIDCKNKHMGKWATFIYTESNERHAIQGFQPSIMPKFYTMSDYSPFFQAVNKHKWQNFSEDWSHDWNDDSESFIDLRELSSTNNKFFENMKVIAFVWLKGHFDCYTKAKEKVAKIQSAQDSMINI